MAHKSAPTFKFPDGNSEALLGELILYISARSADDPNFGATKLNKILWWSDFLAFAYRGKPITGVEYMRLGQGPVPKRLVPVRDGLQQSGDLGVSVVPTRGGYEQKRPVALREPDLSKFSGEDIDLVDRVMAALRRKNAKGVSNLSHGKAWEVAADRASIPYEAVFLSDVGVTRDDLTRTRELARENGWALA